MDRPGTPVLAEPFYLNRVLLDHDSGPGGGHQFFLGDEVAVGFSQDREQVQGFATERNRPASRQELSAGLD